MHSLYLDTSAGLVMGILNPELKWIEYLDLDEKKPSEVIHFQIFSIIKKHNLELTKMRVFISSGPGSYTGMRLSEGIAQIFELINISVFSFYHFEVPYLAGIKSGFWAANAFKGQIFIFNWENGHSEKQLVDKENFKITDPRLGFAVDTKNENFTELTSTKILIEKNPTNIFAAILKENRRVEPYYFRPLDEEFK